MSRSNTVKKTAGTTDASLTESSASSVETPTPKNAPPKLFIVDGSGYIYRAFHAVQHLSTRDGFPTNALFGFTKMLLKLVKDSHADHITVVFDSGEKTFRSDLYAEYKAHRPPAPEELVPQFPYFREIAQALGLTVLAQPGFEADDIIATLVDRCVDTGISAVVVSGDKDLTQLVTDQVRMWDTMNDRWFGPKEVQEKFGVPPEKIVEYLGLMGDASDNVPGLDGVGPKTAEQLIAAYGTVEGVIANVEKLKTDKGLRNRAKIAEQIEQNPTLLRLSRKLVEVRKDVPFQMSIPSKVEGSISSGQVVPGGVSKGVGSLSESELLAATAIRSGNQAELKRLAEKLEFHALFEDFLRFAGGPKPEKVLSKDFEIILRENSAQYFKDLAKQNAFALDVETTGLDPFTSKLVGVSICYHQAGTAKPRAVYIPCGHVTAPVALVGENVGMFEEADGRKSESSDQVAHHQEMLAKQLSLDEITHLLAPVLAADTLKIGHNLKFDLKILARNGMPVKGKVFDTMIAAYLLHPDRGGFGLDAVGREYTGQGKPSYESVSEGYENFSLVPIELAAPYAANDALIAWLLQVKLEPKIKEQGLEKVCYEIEMPLVGILANMELRGVALNTAFLAEMSKEFEAALTMLRAQVVEASGVDFNLNSPKQLAEVLFEKLGIATKGIKKTKTGFSTDSSVLEKLADVHPVPKLLLDYRALHKLKSTYVDALPESVSPITHRLHTSLNQTGTGTGRLSSSDPNLQNIPIQSVEGRKIRGAFVAPSGKLLLSADYSQIELRLLAHLSNDTLMIDAFKAGADIHSATAREILGIGPFDKVTTEQRRIGKTINFGIVYGMGPYRLARDLAIPMAQAKRYIDSYFDRYQGIRTFLDGVVEQAKRDGFVTTIFGRKRILSDLDTAERDEGFIARVATNAPIQGGAADIIKLAMIEIERKILRDKLPLELLLQIHDELLFEVEASKAVEMSKVVEDCMEQVTTLLVPLKVDVGVGHSWQEAH